MGLYDDLQEDLVDAFDNELSDATEIISIITDTISTYDPDTMKNVVSTIKRKVRAVKLTDIEGSIPDEAALTNTASFLIMDSERNGIEFEVGMKIQCGYDESDNYEIDGVSLDPAKASWTLYCSIWG